MLPIPQLLDSFMWCMGLYLSLWLDMRIHYGWCAQVLVVFNLRYLIRLYLLDCRAYFGPPLCSIPQRTPPTPADRSPSVWQWDSFWVGPEIEGLVIVYVACIFLLFFFESCCIYLDHDRILLKLNMQHVTSYLDLHQFIGIGPSLHMGSQGCFPWSSRVTSPSRLTAVHVLLEMLGLLRDVRH